MKAAFKSQALQKRLNDRGIAATFMDAHTLRRAELTLQRWAEKECGGDTGNASYAIERDETTDKPYMCYYPHNAAGNSFYGKDRRVPIADLEKGALKRIAAICSALNIHYYHQTDPRGCSLYVSKEPLLDNDYTRGVNCNG